MLTRSFEREGHRVTAVADGHAALDAAANRPFDVVLLDVALGAGPTGHDVARMLRGRRDVVPIIMLTALDSEADAVQGLEAGADDYVTKPFGLAELRSRIRAVLRRAQGRVVEGSLRVGPVMLDQDERRVAVDGTPGQAHVQRVRAARPADQPPGPRVQPPGAAALDLGRQRLPRPAGDRRPHPPPAREARGEAGGADADPHGPGPRLPLPGGLMARIVPRGLRGRLLAAFVVTSSLTLVVAATVLLGPLQNKLRTQSIDNLRDTVLGVQPQFVAALRPEIPPPQANDDASRWLGPRCCTRIAELRKAAFELRPADRRARAGRRRRRRRRQPARLLLRLRLHGPPRPTRRSPRSRPCARIGPSCASSGDRVTVAVRLFNGPEGGRTACSSPSGS